MILFMFYLKYILYICVSVYYLIDLRRLYQLSFKLKVEIFRFKGFEKNLATTLKTEELFVK